MKVLASPEDPFNYLASKKCTHCINAIPEANVTKPCVQLNTRFSSSLYYVLIVESKLQSLSNRLLLVSPVVLCIIGNYKNLYTCQEQLSYQCTEKYKQVQSIGRSILEMLGVPLRLPSIDVGKATSIPRALVALHITTSENIYVVMVGY